ncbi:hypothetical protein DMUE_1052 [Dictyocoela muelleri]|nr:hypothetical protein DMUE_1052 [Dictyocoela muelleri]
MYVGCSKENKLPIFDIKFWSAHERIKFEIHRTTNACEGWHRSLNSSMAISKPNIARFIDIIQHLEESSRIKFIQIKQGRRLNFEKINFEYEYRLQVIIRNYDNYDKNDFMNVLDNNINWMLGND